jgi:hydrogenase/urease accessory protein HupE
MSPKLTAIALVALLATALRGSASAHEARPAYLELVESQGGRVEVLWKKPARGEAQLAIDPVLPLAPALPGGCLEVGAPRSEALPDASIVRRTLDCGAAGLAGREIRIDGLARTFVDVLVRIERPDRQSTIEVLKPTRPFMWVPSAGAAWTATALTYLRLGIEHILLGVDHLLFVLGLLLLVDDRRTLIETITAFTVAHSLTLAVATLGYASAPLPPLNAAIALSILCLGPEIVRKHRGETSLTVRFPYVVAFGFGLLHGFGFASGLALTGIPASEIPSALLFFNVGVEAGQLAFVFMVLALERAFSQLQMQWPAFVAGAPAYAIGVGGAYWTIDRTVRMFTGG